MGWDLFHSYQNNLVSHLDKAVSCKQTISLSLKPVAFHEVTWAAAWHFSKRCGNIHTILSMQYTIFFQCSQRWMTNLINQQLNGIPGFCSVIFRARALASELWARSQSFRPFNIRENYIFSLILSYNTWNENVKVCFVQWISHRYNNNYSPPWAVSFLILNVPQSTYSNYGMFYFWKYIKTAH